MKVKYKNQNLPYVKEIDILELKALIGLLVFSSVFKFGNESVDSLYATVEKYLDAWCQKKDFFAF